MILSPKMRPAAPPTSARNVALGYVGVSLSIASVSSKNTFLIAEHTLCKVALTGKCK